MGLAEDLLTQSRHLAELDRRRPKQANLRRAISSGHYAVFQLLIADAVQKMIPAQPRGLMDRVSRAFAHGEMKQVCLLFRGEQTSPKLLSVLGRPVSPQMRSIAASFVRLQEERHVADYDPGSRASRTEAMEFIEDAERTFRLWSVLRETEEAAVFLVALAFGPRWDR